jgi:hypothetical protein
LLSRVLEFHRSKKYFLELGATPPLGAFTMRPGRQPPHWVIFGVDTMSDTPVRLADTAEAAKPPAAPTAPPNAPVLRPAKPADPRTTKPADASQKSAFSWRTGNLNAVSWSRRGKIPRQLPSRRGADR